LSHETTDIILCYAAKHFNVLKRSDGTHKCDRRTDTAVANAALYFVVWPSLIYLLT